MIIVVLDDLSEVCLTRRLRRDDMDGCLKATEVAMIAFGQRPPVRYYVGGVLHGEIWFSGEINREDKDKPFLETPVQRMPLWLISSYDVVN